MALTNPTDTNTPTTRTVVYTAPGLDGAVHRVTATNGTWNVRVARQFAAADLRDRTGSLPVDDVADIEILATLH